MTNLIENITPDDMRRLKTGDEVFVGLSPELGFWTRPEKITHDPDHVFIMFQETGCFRTYSHEEAGVYSDYGKSISDILKIRKAVEPKQHEMWAVVWNNMNMCLFPDKERAVLYAISSNKEICHERVTAIFNPFETGGKYTEGQGLELLEGGE